MAYNDLHTNQSHEGEGGGDMKSAEAQGWMEGSKIETCINLVKKERGYSIQRHLRRGGSFVES